MRHKLNKIKSRVLRILQEKPQARNSDNLLYLYVIREIAEEQQINLNLSIEDFLITMPVSVFPPFESVRRARQKAQAENKELSADNAVEVFREEFREEFRKFARSGR
jgi:hypothetical protein